MHCAPILDSPTSFNAWCHARNKSCASHNDKGTPEISWKPGPIGRGIPISRARRGVNVLKVSPLSAPIHAFIACLSAWIFLGSSGPRMRCFLDFGSVSIQNRREFRSRSTGYKTRLRYFRVDLLWDIDCQINEKVMFVGQVRDPGTREVLSVPCSPHR
jgi:hypothetical protein